ncbi:Isoquinoline 1-oxidoreductase subunit [Rhizobium johnstonii]|uniref:Isoquinoline 1-oxidoreductase subunit n=1 Tax=Rhizobium TaxID=379 RepID=UPI00140FBCC9|nr:Isoquinoline 1-oxidoreductase subunit [Rhizobium leguminosarum]QIO63987.1 Isoquinoline 1-oxidoreductase subunit [Rhizobium leguminosarum bv. trifolii]
MRFIFGLALAITIGAFPAIAQDETLRSPKDFNGIKDQSEKSAAIFEEMTKVITDPRCINCHPVDNRPRQGEDSHLHMPPIVRWDSGDFGPPGLRCSSCHGDEPIKFVGTPGTIPGHVPWRLAPQSMGWIGLSHAQICAQLKDPTRNGNRSLEDIHHHHATDALVGSAWHPGEDRKPAPGTQDIFAALTKAWIETGAACPK